MAVHLPRSAPPFPDENLSPNFGAPNNQDKPLKLLFKHGLLPTVTPDDTTVFDSKIESIHNQIALLSDRLDALRLRKEANRNISHVPQKLITHSLPLKQINTKTHKAVRICDPSETARSRGVSMCPSDIAGGTRSMKLPDNSLNRRKSCFWKVPPPLEEEEEAAAEFDKARARRLSLAPGTKMGSRTLSPKSRQSKLTDLRKGIVTVGSKSNNLIGKKEAAAASSRLQPKKLFGDAKPAPAAKPASKNARVVPSRYSQMPATALLASRAANARPSPAKETKKKRQARPSVLDDGYGTRKRCGASDDGRSSVSSCMTDSTWALEEVAMALPRIKAMRYLGDSPRDSGRAKRVAELVGKTTYFTSDAAAEVDEDAPICQIVDYDDDDDDDYVSLV